MTRSVRFTRDGKRLLLRDGQMVAVLELPSGTEHALPGHDEGGRFGDVRAFVGFEEEAWVVTGETPVLRRFSTDGTAIGTPVALPLREAAASLLPAPAGPPSALWTGGPPCELRVEDGALSVEELAEDATFLLPLAPRRRLGLRDGTLVRVESGREVWLPAAGQLEGARLLDGAPILDGRAVALLVERGGAPSLLVVALESGLVQHRIDLPGIRGVRFAAGRSHALVQVDDRRMLVLDLRFGRTIKQWSEPATVIDFDVDSAARNLVLQRRAADGTVETFFGGYRDVVGLSARSATASEPRDPGAGAGPSQVQGPEQGPVAEDAAEDHAGAAAPPPAAEEAPEKAGGPLETATAERYGSATSGARTPAAAPAQAPPVPRRGPVGYTPGAGSRRQGLETRPAVPRPSAGTPPRPIFPTQPHAMAKATATATERPGRAVAPPRAASPVAPADGGALGSTLLELHPRRSSQPHPPAPAEAPPGAIVSARLAAAAGSALDAALDLVVLRCARALLDAGGDPGPAAGSAAADVLRQLRGVPGVPPDARRIAETVEAAEAAFDAERTSPPFGPLAAQFGLSPAALDLLLVVAAPWLRPELAGAYARIGGTGDGEATLVLAARMLPGRSMPEQLGGDSPLRRHGLIEGGQAPAGPLRIAPLVARRLSGEALDEPGRHGAVIVRAVRPRSDELALPVGLAAAVRARLAGEPRVLLRGRAGSGRRSLIAALLTEQGRTAGFVDAALGGLPRDELPLALAGELRGSALRGLVPCAVGIDDFAAPLCARLAGVFAAHQGPLLLVGGPAAPPLEGFDAVDVPPLGPEARRTLLVQSLRRHVLPTGAAAAISQRLRAPPGVLVRVVEALAASGARAESDDALEAALIEAHHLLRADRLRPGTTLPASRSLRAALFDPVTDDALAALAAQAGRPPDDGAGGILAVFRGGSGTGRRLAADLLAGQLGLDLHRVAAAELGPSTPEALPALSRLLEETEAGGLLLHVVAADRLLAEPPPPSLLARLACFSGIAVFSVASPAAIDPALGDRVTADVPFPLPDEKAREAIWRLHLPAPRPGDAEPPDPAALARYPLAGGAIRAAVERALLLAEAEQSSPRPDHFARAARLLAARAS